MSSTHTASPSTPAFNPDAVRGRIRTRLLAAFVLATLVPVLALEVILRAEATPVDLVAYRVMLGAAAALLVSLAFSRFLARGWVRQSVAIREALDRLASGQSHSAAAVISNDELGDIAVALNHWNDGTRPAPVSNSHRRFQEALNKALAASLEVSSSAGKLGASTEKLSKGSEEHVAQINDTSAAVDEIVESIRQVAENTFASAKVAEEARHNATVGSQAVANTIKGMQRIRNQVQSTSKRIKQLGESTQQIGEIVQLISDVADRTSLLALNASIQAAMAGEAGRGFGVVAEEVELLSKRCNEATKQMARLVKGVQAETSEATAGMEESIAEVVNGSKLASQAGEALADIDAVSVRLADLINSISTAAKQQVRGGLLASRSMNEISAVMHENSIGTKETAQSVRKLAAIADEFRAAVERLKAAAPSRSNVTSGGGSFEPPTTLPVHESDAWSDAEAEAEAETAGTAP